MVVEPQWSVRVSALHPDLGSADVGRSLLKLKSSIMVRDFTEQATRREVQTDTQTIGLEAACVILQDRGEGHK